MAEKVKRPRLMVLNEPDGRRFSRALALEIGRDHAEVFLQIEYLISISNTPELEGKLWTRQSIASLQEEHFPYWGRTFISGILDDLANGYDHLRYTYTGQGRQRKRSAEKVHIPALLDRGWHNTWGADTTTWYTLNLEGINTLQSAKLDIDALSVTAKRKRVSAKATTGEQDTETGFRENGNELPDMRQPVPTHAGAYITETPTETPTERGERGETESIPEPPPAFPVDEFPQPGNRTPEPCPPGVNPTVWKFLQAGK